MGIWARKARGKKEKRKRRRLPKPRQGRGQKEGRAGRKTSLDRAAPGKQSPLAPQFFPPSCARSPPVRQGELSPPAPATSLGFWSRHRSLGRRGVCGERSFGGTLARRAVRHDDSSAYARRHAPRPAPSQMEPRRKGRTWAGRWENKIQSNPAPSPRRRRLRENRARWLEAQRWSAAAATEEAGRTPSHEMHSCLSSLHPLCPPTSQLGRVI